MHGTMKLSAFFAAALFWTFAGTLFAANSIPAGTILPVRLNSTVSSVRSTSGQTVTARVMQDVPLADGSVIHAGAKVIGRVVSVTPASNGSAGRVVLRFDMLETRQAKTAIQTDLRAIASFTAVEQAQIPISGPDRGTPPNAWTTQQIGGDTVYRGGGPVEAVNGKVGEPVYGGVLSQLNANPDGGCRGAIDAHNTQQALWVFSSDACGAYGLARVTVRHAGRSNPTGEIVLAASKGDVKISAGAGMLLRVDSANVSGA